MWIFTGSGIAHGVSRKIYQGARTGSFIHGSRHRRSQMKRLSKGRKFWFK